jgi:hypothetical protein
MPNLAGHTATTGLGPQMPSHHELGIAGAEGKQGRAAEELAVIGGLHCPQALRQRTLRRLHSPLAQQLPHLGEVTHRLSHSGRLGGSGVAVDLERRLGIFARPGPQDEGRGDDALRLDGDAQVVRSVSARWSCLGRCEWR